MSKYKWLGRSAVAAASCWVIMAALALRPEARAGNGTFTNGMFNFCVSVRFNATAAELAQIRTAFQNGSQILADATDGQHRFGTITIVNNSGASETAEYWIHPSTNRAYATYGEYGVRGKHVNLFFLSNFQGTDGADGDAYTIAHEHAHHAYGVADEYAGPGGDAECAAPAPPADTAALTFCLMDNYFTRGGRAGGGGTYTLNEFCIAANHDLMNAAGVGATNTYQESFYHQSCWTRIAGLARRSATGPAALPVAAAPAAHTVTFREGTGGLRVMLVIDRSGSMSGDRINFARRGVSTFLNFVRVGDAVGLVSFSSSERVDASLAPVDAGGATVAALRTAVRGLSASGSTDIGDALIAARNQLTSQTNRSCNEVIVLLSDGDHNTGTEPSTVIPSLQSEGITVLSVAIGSGISTAGQATLQSLATATGGRFFSVAGTFDLIGLFLRLAAESTGSGILARAPFTLPAGAATTIDYDVEPGANSAIFALALADANDPVQISLISPAGVLNTATNLEANVGFLRDENLQAFRVDSPASGRWQLVVQAGSRDSGSLETIAIVDNPGVGLALSVEADQVVAPQPIIIHATPTFGGLNVVGAEVAGEVIRPDSSRLPIELFDDGQAVHGDLVSGDGIYSALFDAYNRAGTYTFDLATTNVTGRTYAGESLFESVGIPVNDQPVPPFTRAASVTAVLLVAPATSVSLMDPLPAPVFNRQTSLYEQWVSITNSSGSALAAAELNFTVPAGITVYNANRTNAGVPAIHFNFDPPLPAGDTFALKVEYYSATRTIVPAPLITATAAAEAPITVLPATETARIRRIQPLANGAILLEFEAVPGRRYAIQYSEDMSVWLQAQPGVLAEHDRLFWIDDGPPKTRSRPTGGSRFYRVVLLP